METKPDYHLAPSKPMFWVSKPRGIYIDLFGIEEAYRLVGAKGTYIKAKHEEQI